MARKIIEVSTLERDAVEKAMIALAQDTVTTVPIHLLRAIVVRWDVADPEIEEHP